MILKVIALIAELCLVSASTSNRCMDGNTCRTTTTTSMASSISEILPTELKRGYVCSGFDLIYHGSGSAFYSIWDCNKYCHQLTNCETFV